MNNKKTNTIVEAIKNYNNPEIIAKISENLGKAIIGINENEIKIIMNESQTTTSSGGLLYA
ncbi:hypothetical protein KST00_09535 [Fusobacterium animalis]|uniref:hypothetical protein n=1 Tax=Fusobacterium animalis TaxID=76859 RepID=UPI0030CD5603